MKSGREYVENASTYFWKDSDVVKYGATMVPPAYQDLKNGPININSKEGKALIEKTIQAGKDSSPCKRSV